MMKQHRGLTLVELLVTLAVVMALTALVLPSVKSMLVDRKSTQAATIVRNFIEAARSRAIGSNNAVAVVLERASSYPLDRNEDGFLDASDMIGDGTANNPYRLASATSIDPIPAGAPPDINFTPYNTCLRLSLAERPRPRPSSMLGAWAGNTVNAILPSNAANIQLIQSALGNSHPQAGFAYFQIVSPINLVNLLTIELELAPGNEVSFGNSGAKYMITDVLPGSTNGPTNFWFRCMSSTSADDNNELATPGMTPNSSYANLVVYPKVRPVATQSVTLPRGMCIDLSLSGFAEVGSINGRDRRFRFSSVWLHDNAPPSPEELRPVYLEFGPDGMLSTVYANGRQTQARNLVPIQTVDDVYLHIGKTEQVLVPALPIGQEQNLTDESAYVVRVSAKSGAIACAPVAGFETQSQLLGIPPTSVGNILSLSRQGVLGQPLTGQ
jgi:type II secretory pathway pseudopilin PulG